jgi:hypothetical protein
LVKGVTWKPLSEVATAMLDRVAAGVAFGQII